MIYINTYSNIIYQTSQQRCTRLPCIPKERRECPTAASNISLPVKKKRENTFYLQKIYIGQYLSFRNRDGDACKCEKVKKQTFQESSRCSWEWYRVHSTRYRVHCTRYWVRVEQEWPNIPKLKYPRYSSERYRIPLRG